MTKKQFFRYYTCLTKGIFTWITAAASIVFGKTAVGTDSIFVPAPTEYLSYLAAAVIVYLAGAILCTTVVRDT